jgi:hypothetical protein
LTSPSAITVHTFVEVIIRENKEQQRAFRKPQTKTPPIPIPPRPGSFFDDWEDDFYKSTHPF